MATGVAYLAGSNNGPMGLSAIDAATGMPVPGFVPMGNLYQILTLNCTETSLMPGGKLVCAGMFVGHSAEPSPSSAPPDIQSGLVVLDADTGDLIEHVATAIFPPTSDGRVSVGEDGAVFATAATPLLYKFDAGLGLIWSVSGGTRLGDLEDMGDRIAAADEGAATVRMFSKDTGGVSAGWTPPATPWTTSSCIKSFAGGLAVNSGGVTVLTASGGVNAAFAGVTNITGSIGSSDTALAVAAGYLHYPFLFINGTVARWDVARVDAAGNVDIAYTFTPKFAAGRNLAAPLLLAPAGDGLIVKTSVSDESDQPQLLRLDADGTAHAGYTPPQALPVYLLAELAAPDPEPEPKPVCRAAAGRNTTNVVSEYTRDRVHYGVLYYPETQRLTDRLRAVVPQGATVVSARWTTYEILTCVMSDPQIDGTDVSICIKAQVAGNCRIRSDVTLSNGQTLSMWHVITVPEAPFMPGDVWVQGPYFVETTVTP